MNSTIRDDISLEDALLRILEEATSHPEKPILMGFTLKNLIEIKKYIDINDINLNALDEIIEQELKKIEEIDGDE